MKKLSFLLLIATCCQSCFIQTKYFQLYETEFDNNMKQSYNSIVWENEDCRILYNLWSNKGSVGFFITNKTDSILYVDLTKTYYICNGMSNVYYQGRHWTATSTRSTTSAYANAHGNTSVSAYGSTRASAQGNVYVSSPYIYGNASGQSKSYANVNSNSNAYSYGRSTTSTNTNTTNYSEQPIISIAPHASYYFEEYTITNSILRDCDLEERPKRKELPKLEFDAETTPLEFTNYITYQVENRQEVRIDNHFYVKQITNIRSDAIRKTKQAEECGKKLDKTETYYVFPIDDKSNCFYIEYWR